MRKRIDNWQGQRFAYIWLEGEPGHSLEKQSQGLFDRAGPELASLGLALDKNVVRTRVYGRTRDARNIVSAARGRAFSGQARAATSSFISPDHLDWYSAFAQRINTKRIIRRFDSELQVAVLAVTSTFNQSVSLAM